MLTEKEKDEGVDHAAIAHRLQEDVVGYLFLWCSMCFFGICGPTTATSYWISRFVFPPVSFWLRTTVLSWL